MLYWPSLTFSTNIVLGIPAVLGAYRYLLGPNVEGLSPVEFTLDLIVVVLTNLIYRCVMGD